MNSEKTAAEALPTAEQNEMLDNLQKKTFAYFLHEHNPDTGLIADKTSKKWPASIAATGFGLSAYPIGMEEGFLSREEAVERTRTVLRFLWRCPQGDVPHATGYKGFFYHFLDMKSGERALKCELSTVDTAFLMVGALTARQYFQRETEEEAEIRDLADKLYRRVDWAWALNGGATLSQGWRPKRGFLRYRYVGYDESLLLYVLALGSPTHPIPAESFAAVTDNYKWKRIYDYEYLYAGPLFIHQYPQIWLDLRDVQDDFMREKGIDYFENSRRATYVQQQYAIRNPKQYNGYGEFHWGITASDGPGPSTQLIDGIERVFFDYIARGAPFGPDDGTVAPWAAVASLPFAPEIVLPTIRRFNELDLESANPYGYKATINQTYPEHSRNRYGWVSEHHYGINQGPIVMMIENYQNELVWKLMRDCSYVREGLRRAGFRGGWL